MGVAAGVGWGEEEAAVGEEGIEGGNIEGAKAFEDVVVEEGEAEPEAVAAGAGGEGAAEEALGVDGVVKIEISYIRDCLDVIEGYGG